VCWIVLDWVGARANMYISAILGTTSSNSVLQPRSGRSTIIARIDMRLEPSARCTSQIKSATIREMEIQSKRLADKVGIPAHKEKSNRVP
jgi:hypothetical protein